jgi:hypothetical protein
VISVKLMLAQIAAQCVGNLRIRPTAITNSGPALAQIAEPWWNPPTANFEAE